MAEDARSRGPGARPAGIAAPSCSQFAASFPKFIPHPPPRETETQRARRNVAFQHRPFAPLRHGGAQCMQVTRGARKWSVDP